MDVSESETVERFRPAWRADGVPEPCSAAGVRELGTPPGSGHTTQRRARTAVVHCPALRQQRRVGHVTRVRIPDAARYRASRLSRLTLTSWTTLDPYAGGDRSACPASRVRRPCRRRRSRPPCAAGRWPW